MDVVCKQSKKGKHPIVFVNHIFIPIFVREDIHPYASTTHVVCRTEFEGSLLGNTKLYPCETRSLKSLYVHQIANGTITLLRETNKYRTISQILRRTLKLMRPTLLK